MMVCAKRSSSSSAPNHMLLWTEKNEQHILSFFLDSTHKVASIWGCLTFSIKGPCFQSLTTLFKWTENFCVSVDTYGQ